MVRARHLTLLGRVIGMTETGWSYGTVPGDPNGTQLASQTRTTTFTYDTTGRLTHVSEPGGRLTVRTYHDLAVGAHASKKPKPTTKRSPDR